MFAAGAILLNILKVIGIIVLILLALIILLVCLVLFGAVTVRFTAAHSGERLTEDWKASGSVSWLGFVLRAAFTYDAALSVSVKIFGFTIFPRAEKKEKKKKRRPEAGKEKQQTADQEMKSGKEPRQPQEDQTVKALPEMKPEEEMPRQAAQKTQQRSADPQQAKEPEGQERQPKEQKKQKKQPEGQKQQSEGKEPKKKKKPGKAPGRARAEGASGTSGISGTMKKVREILSDEAMRPAAAVIFSALGGFLHSIRVFDLKGDVVYSAGSPDLTGLLTGALSLNSACYGKDISLSPDFTADEPVFDGSLSGGFSLRLIHVVIAAGKIAADKNIRKMMHLIQK